MRRPVPIAAAIIAVLLVLGTPFLGVHFGQPDARVLPASATTRAASDGLTANFRSGEANALSVVAPVVSSGSSGSSGAGSSQISAYASALSRVPAVARVDALTGSFAGGVQVAPASPATTARFANPTGTWLSVVPDRLAATPVAGG